MRIRSLIALACAALALLGCQKGDKRSHGSLPSSIRVEKLDLTGASALAVMPYSASPSVKTRAGEEEQYEDRLYIVDMDGKTKLASFTINDSKYNNTIWKEIRKSLTIVPTSIFFLSEDLLLFGDSWASHNYIEWQKEASNQEEIDAISDLLTSLGGPYLLRISDGALFRSPFVVGMMDPDRPMNSLLGNVVKATADAKSFVVEPFDDSYFGYMIRSYEIFGLGRIGYDMPLGPWIISDKGDYFEMKHPLENIQPFGGGAFGFMVTQDNRIIELGAGNGCFSYDLDLNPLYVDYAHEVQEVFSRIGPNYEGIPPFDFDGDTYVIAQKNQISVYKVYLTANELNCSLLCSARNSVPLGFSHYTSITYPTDNGINILVPGAKIIIDVVNGKCEIDAIPDDFPQEWNAYNDNGIAYEMTDNEILKYDINTNVKTSIPIHWEQVDFGGFVSYSASLCNGVFSVSGRTRDANSVTVLIDAETGNVSITDLAEYSGSVVKTYYRLN